MNIDKAVNDLYQKLGWEPPREWFAKKVNRNIESNLYECEYLRQTGRTTNNCLVAITHMLHGKDVAMPVHNASAYDHFASFIKHALGVLKVRIIKERRLPRYIQIQNGASIVFPSMPTSLGHGIAHQSTLAIDLRGRAVDVLLPDNALIDLINIVSRFQKPEREQMFLLECERALTKKEWEVKDEFVTSYGETFRNGDLIEHGNSGALIVDLYEDRYNMKVLVNGQPRSWYRYDLNLMVKCQDDGGSNEKG